MIAPLAESKPLDHLRVAEAFALLVYAIGGTLAKCDLFGIPSTSHWTGVAIIVQFPRTKSCIFTLPRS
jgi:hypothetical protein